ncbi:MAG: ROK family protein [Acidimicrobiia bacterium]|nr:ROK family protein [Acidimicrobiia bacterium]
MGRVTIGVDAGGTKTAAAMVTPGGEIVEFASVPTPRSDAEAALATLVDVTAEMMSRAGGHEVAGIGMGLAGLVDRARKVFVYGPNYPLLDVDVGRAMERFGLPVLVANDADVAAWAEYLFGAGRRCREMVMVTLGTGIGGGIVSGGRPFGGANGFAGEIGHLVFAADGVLEGDGAGRHWERFASGTALDAMARDAAAADPAGAIAGVAGGDPARARGADVVAAVTGGDAVALEVMDRYAARVAVGIAGLIQVLDPARVVVGGGVCEAGDALFEPLRSHVRRLVTGAEHRPEVPVVPAELGPHAGVIGAASLALEH